MKNYFPEEVRGHKLESLSKKPLVAFAKRCNQAACEGTVLLRNENKTLPIAKGSVISVFGRIQERYYGMGTGSGGRVNSFYKTDILSSLRKSENVILNEKLAKIYADWIAENPYDDNNGGWTQPTSQKEMPLTDEIVDEAAKESDFALIIIGRTAGEDKDNVAEKGAYFLSDGEEQMIALVTKKFKKVCVYMNVGSIMDTSWVDTYRPGALIYGWQGGMEGGSSAVKILTGEVCPSGKLADTIAYKISDYPSDANFGGDDKNIYAEDIYVGYKYFETFAKDRVQYPFGFGLSYTSLDISFRDVLRKKDGFVFTFSVKNTGEVTGKEVVQIYFEAPQGKLGKPSRVLAGYAKTRNIPPKKSVSVEITVPTRYLASYDDAGVTGYKSCYVLESGKYNFYVGSDVRSATKFYDFSVRETTIAEKCSEAAAPVENFMRMVPKSENETLTVCYEPAPLRTYDIEEKIKANLPKDIPYTGDKGYKLKDVADNKCSMDEFLAQIPDSELAYLCIGEGMRSFKVMTDTASIFGGVTDNLIGFGIPLGTTNDGPCGVRDLTSGVHATSMPNGTCIACTWNDALAEELMVYEGLELHVHEIDALLGPGINIHRHPLNGRNFEYFSEDPLLAGKMAAAMCRGVSVSGKSATIKHMAANNQEKRRTFVDSVMSERALRETYLRPFELAVKEGGADSIMTSYNPINGIWCASNYDINTAILRNEWGYDGLIMTDWWAKCNGKEGAEATIEKLAEMIRSQNDVYMLYDNAEKKKNNIMSSLENGTLHRSELHRCAANICKFLLHTVSFRKFVQYGYDDPYKNFKDESKLKCYLLIENAVDKKHYPLKIKKIGRYLIRATYTCSFPELEQHAVWFMLGSDASQSVMYSNPGDGKTAVIESIAVLTPATNTLRLAFEPGVNFLKVEVLGI